MNKLAILFGFTFLCSCEALPTSMPEFDDAIFSLDLSYEEAEHGDDSNGTSTEITIRDNKLNYHWEYWGYHPSEDYEREREFTLDLTDEEFVEIKKLIEESGMWTEVDETQDTGDIGDSIDIDLHMKDGSQTITSQLYGMEWQLSTKEGNIENLEFVDGIQDFIYSVKKMGE